MEQKILIGILGKNDYQTTKYKLEKHEPIESRLVCDVLHRIFNFDRILIVGTEQSSWQIADELFDRYEKIFIPYGKSEEEFWDIFKIMTNLNIDNSHVYFDITHGFRSIPVFLSTILNFYSKVKNIKIEGVYYGIFEAKENDITPVVNILPLLDINRFIDSTFVFQKYSDARDFQELIDEKYSKLSNEDKKRFGHIKQFSKSLNYYSKSVGFTALDLYFESLVHIAQKAEKFMNNEIPVYLKPIEFL
jgi:CRISPR-associated DxTHG motif protein